MAVFWVAAPCILVEVYQRFKFHLVLEELVVRSASQEIPRFLWNKEDYYHVHKRPPSIPTPSQMNPTHTLQPYFPKIRLILPSPCMPVSYWLPFPYRLFNPNSVSIFHLPPYEIIKLKNLMT
jgi:hypothetical protein